MKKLLGLLAAAVVLTQVDGAAAQQKWTIPGPAAHHYTDQHAHVRFPIPASVYELKISKALEKLRSSHPRGPVTQGDINKTILLLRDCASRVEADGYVTQAEMSSCNRVVAAYKQERVVEVMASSDSSDWQRWSSQSSHPSHHTPPTQH